MPYRPRAVKGAEVESGPGDEGHVVPPARVACCIVIADSKSPLVAIENSPPSWEGHN